MRAEFNIDPRGRRELIISDERNDRLFLAVADWLRYALGWELVGQLDGPDQRYWDFSVGGKVLTLHSEHYSGVSLYSDDAQADSLLDEMYERINSSGLRLRDEEVERTKDFILRQRERFAAEMNRQREAQAGSDEKSERLLADARSLLAKVQSRHKAATLRREKKVRTFRLGDMVRIRSGPFAAFTGKIEGINQARRLLKVVVEIFGRVTPVKLKFSDVDEISLDE